MNQRKDFQRVINDYLLDKKDKVNDKKETKSN